MRPKWVGKKSAPDCHIFTPYFRTTESDHIWLSGKKGKPWYHGAGKTCSSGGKSPQTGRRRENMNQLWRLSGFKETHNKKITKDYHYAKCSGKSLILRYKNLAGLIILEGERRIRRLITYRRLVDVFAAPSDWPSADLQAAVSILF